VRRRQLALNAAVLRSHAVAQPLDNKSCKRGTLMTEITVIDEREKANKNITTIIYALYAASLVIGITGLVAIVMNYVKRGDVAGSWLESHFRWQIRTFWFCLLWAFVGVITLPLWGLGTLILIGNLIWYIYRIVKGFLRLNDNKPVYAD
jgi:uncharacterized membrane protein